MSDMKQLHEVGGLMSCLFTHEVKQSSAQFKWDGPKLSWETWQQVLAFFRWTNTEHHSESQVRFFVNHRLQLWAAHAFPQEARTGMSTTELDTPDARTQRARFSDAEGWFYWGTAHHHCTGGAFQSGQDLSNEKNQDGLHLTVGHMDRDTHSLHSRLYVAGFEIAPHLDWFWDVGNPDVQLMELSPFLMPLLPPHWKHELASRAMCVAAPADAQFPDEWKQNMIGVRRAPAFGKSCNEPKTSLGRPLRTSIWSSPYDVEAAAAQFQHVLDLANSEAEHWNLHEAHRPSINALEFLSGEESEGRIWVELIEILQQNDIHFDALLECLEEKSAKQEMMMMNEALTQAAVPNDEGHDLGGGQLPA